MFWDKFVLSESQNKQTRQTTNQIFSSIQRAFLFASIKLHWKLQHTLKQTADVEH